MNTIDLLKGILQNEKNASRKEVNESAQKLLLEAFKRFSEGESVAANNSEEPPRLKDIIPIEELVKLSKKFNFPLPPEVKEYYSDDLIQLADSVGVSVSYQSQEDTPVEHSETGHVYHQNFFSVVYDERFPDDKPSDQEEEEEEFDSGKEFDDDRAGDENWIEPNYNPEDFVSKATYNSNAFRSNALQFIHSLGYDSYRRHNLCVIDENTIVYLSGNYVHVYDIPTASFTYIRSFSGGGLGHCAKHPCKSIFAVGERGFQPVIIIYDYPSLKVLRVLRGGADIGINYLRFSPNGKWLLSLASKPDSSLTVWNWNMERIVVKQRNVDREIWQAEYNAYVFGGIITSGLEHITFWKLIETFTGLKLLPTPGKWGNKTFCDVNTFCALPENLVIGSNTNNNLLLWEDDLVTMEVSRRNNLPLHDEDIVYLEFKEKYDEIFSVGLDGKYKVWDYTRIGSARREGKEVLEIQPTFQRKIQDDFGVAKPLSFQKVYPNNPDSEMYFMQDKEGSIWSVEMAVKEKLEDSKRVFFAHDGPVIDIFPSPAGYYIATVGNGGRLHVYNSRSNKLIMKSRLCVSASSLLWLPIDMDKTASLIVIGFIDGTLRLVVLSIRAREVNAEESDNNFINVIQAFKPHNRKITVLSVNPHRKNERIVLSGSEDCRIFLYRVKKYKRTFLRLCPVGFVLLPDPIYSITWNKNKESFLVTSFNGSVSEVTLPEDIPDPPTNSFEIKLPLRTSRFKSVKSEIIQKLSIQRNLKRKEKRKLRQMIKELYVYKLLEDREGKIEEPNKLAGEFTETMHKVMERIKEDRLIWKKAEKDAARDQALLSRGYYQYETSEEEEEDDEELENKIKPSVSKMSYDSYYNFQKAPNIVLRRLQKIIDENKKKKVVTDDLVENFSDRKVHELVDEEMPEIEYINKKEKEKRFKYMKHGRKSDIEQEETDEDKETVPNKQFVVENVLATDKFIISELMKLLDEELDCEDIDPVSEDEEVPSRHYPSGPIQIYFADYINDNCIWVSPGGYDAGYIYEYELDSDEPYKCTPIVEFENTEMTCFLYVNGGYLIVGQGDGCIKVINVNPDNFTDFSNYWLYAMHDNIKGKLKKICISHDNRYLYSIGEDSNIFYYSVNLINTKFGEQQNLPQLMQPPLELRIDDYMPPEELSLEDSIKKAELELAENIKVDAKLIMQQKLENLANKFEIIFTLNEGLPETQRLPLDYFVINEEFENKLIYNFLEKKNRETEQLRHDYVIAKNIKEKVYNYFINPIKTHKIYIYAHSYRCKVTSFYQGKLSIPFLMAEREIDQIMMDTLKKEEKWNKIFSSTKMKLENSLAITNEPAAKKKYKIKDLEIRPFVPGEDKMLKDMPRFQKSVYTKITEQRKRRKLLQNLHRVFKHQSEEKRRDFLENTLYTTKPQKDTVFRLKCDPLYNVAKNTTKERKFYQLVTTKRKIYNLTSNFNALVLKTREMKSQALSLSASCCSDLQCIATEFENVIWPKLPQKVEIFEPLEFPENTYEDKPPIFPHEQEMKYQYRSRLFHQVYEMNKTFPIDMGIVECGVAHGEYSSEYTPWEMEFIYERKQFLMSEYLKKHCLMNELLDKYDDEIRKLAFMKVEYEVKIAYLKICFLKYFEELQVIKAFQLLVDDIDRKCSVFIKQKHVYILKMNIRKQKIKKCTFDIIGCVHRCQVITTNFIKKINQNPVYIQRFIMKIFNRTWAQEIKKREKSESDSDMQQAEETASSSSEIDSGPPEPDEDEIDSDDIDRLVAEQQENFIEVGKIEIEAACGKELLDHTLETKEKRWFYEKQMAQNKQEINAYNEQIKKIREKVLITQTIIAIYKVKKSLILEEKHKQLSKIRSIVVLKASQMQHFDVSTNEFPPMSESIVFPLYTLKNLEARKRKLKNKILTTGLDQRETLKHVKRLNLDIEYLKTNLQDIKDRIRTEKLNKFGYDINVPRMEETILRRIIKDYKYDTFPFHMKFHTDITRLQQELAKIKRSAAEQIKQNTYEHLKYGALLEQKRQYKEIMMKIQSKKQVQYMTLEELDVETEKFKNLLQIQENMKETIINATHQLSDQHCPKVPLIRQKMNMKQKMVLRETCFESESESESMDSGYQKKYNIVKKKRKKEQIKVEDLRKVGSFEEYPLLKYPHINKYKLINQTNDDKSPLDFKSDEEMKNYSSESEDEDLQEEESDDSFYGD